MRKDTSTSQPFASAIAIARSSTIFIVRARVASDHVRMVPVTTASSGMTFEASPAWTVETPITTGSFGLSIIRPTMVFSESTTCAAAFTGSIACAQRAARAGVSGTAGERIGRTIAAQGTRLPLKRVIDWKRFSMSSCSANPS